MNWFKEEGWINERVCIVDPELYGAPKSMACYLVRGSEKIALIDASGKSEARRVARKLSKLGTVPDTLVLTHSHWDHAGGAAVLKKKFPTLEVVASHHGVDSLLNAPDFNAQFGEVVDPVGGVTLVRDGDMLELGGLDLEVLETPGHTDCSISLLDPEDEFLFIGDAFGYKFTEDLLVPPIMPPEFDERKLYSTIDEVAAVDAKGIGVAHFGLLTGDLARQFPGEARREYDAWKDLLLATWRGGQRLEDVVAVFREKFTSAGFPGPQVEFVAPLFGDWVVKGMKSAGFF
ncbi:MAG: MBL fold metallo-hydrolase [Promethearchaeota archaeon]